MSTLRKANKSTVMHLIEQAVSFVPAIVPEELDWYVGKFLVDQFVGAWRRKKNRKQIQEIVARLAVKYPQIDLPGKMNRAVNDFHYNGWDLYDYRNS